MPDFKNPAAFLLLLLIPALFIARKTGIFTRPAFVISFGDWHGKSFLWQKKTRILFSMLSSLCGILGFIAVVIAFSEPVIYSQERVYNSRGTDIMFVIDVSPSMAARDISGTTRLESAKKAVSSLVTSNPGASFGIVAVAEESALLVPPTNDRETFFNRLESLSAGLLGNGTALGSGLATAVFHLVSSASPKKCIVLVTDGESNAGAIHPETAAELASKNSITVYTLGLGTNGSVPIEYTDPETGKKYLGYLNSTYDENLLRSISGIGGGRFFEVRSLNDFSLALSMIIKNQSVIQSFHTKITARDFYDKFVIAAAFLFFVCWAFRRLGLQEFI